MKSPARPTVKQAQLVLQANKQAVREMEWIKKPTASNPPWVQYESACEILNEVREDVTLRLMYRHMKTEWIGQAAMHAPSKFSAALSCGNHRISALDTDTTQHTNKIGIGMPFHRKSFSTPHLHVWTEKGYGYAEPFTLDSLELEDVFKVFCNLASITPNGPFAHPMTRVNQTLF
jgi:hypothetical protein